MKRINAAVRNALGGTWLLAVGLLLSLLFTAPAAFAVGDDYITGGAELLVPVGDAENAPDPANDVNGTKFGGVPYEYSIGKYAVTNAQYAKFLNAVNPTGVDTYSLYNASMAGTFGGITYTDGADAGSKYAVKDGPDANNMSYADKPVNYVSFWDAARFCNWLTNGGGTATGGDAGAIATSSAALTETGMYALNGTENPENGSISRQLSGSGYAVSSEDEWYKAAYYNGDTASYRAYPVTAGSLSQTVANYYDGGFAIEKSPYIAAVDYYDGVDGANSYYGTFQQGGNVWEWNDTTIENNYRGLRGGSFAGLSDALASSARDGGYPGNESFNCGFRVSSLAVPEPSTYGLMGGAMLLGIMMLRRSKNRVTL